MAQRSTLACVVRIVDDILNGRRLAYLYGSSVYGRFKHVTVALAETVDVMEGLGSVKDQLVGAEPNHGSWEC